MSTELLTEESVGDYLASRDDLASRIDASTARAREVGDGNLNLVFVARDASGRSLALKQTLPYVRGDHSWAVTEDSIFAEARGLEAAAQSAPGLAPDYFGLDADRRLVVIEDLSEWRVWRGALNDGIVSTGAGAAVGELVAALGFSTSYFGLPPAEVQSRVARSINPELWQITEDLVFTEPYFDHPHNSWDAGAEDAVLALRDDRVRSHVAELKHAFLTRAEALLHGDLHTGSVFVPVPSGGAGAASAGQPAAKAFDFEFGAYGPTAFDLGMFFGNILIAQARDAVAGANPAFSSWLSGLYSETWSAFERGIRTRWPERVDPVLTDDYLETWLEETWRLAVGYAGVEAIRRSIGWAKVSDLETLPEPQRVEAVRRLLTTSRELVTSGGRIGSAADLSSALSGVAA
ncbi:MAG: S-methyl-5-thioribose kinase [Actinomyces sp.]|nr:S-methyl-5-thioribose kinase [Actinomyces sp.]MCI1642513.1 S-methyl-5-thioribose kinase [Actinomyces sp.]MCI1663054.1 S-methyl-5-thioribose kinase [Actinomyces sp.]MCI1691692.1 S-methyl-5-thioribose kinase [Actinomyces sp.]MCI1788641.1 S-methyl-5-thioribose kinase [Actinomyces sp.]MCI1829743.1 S-methyl-5-thioribose kinase [Actinomyces sp.]